MTYNKNPQLNNTKPLIHNYKIHYSQTEITTTKTLWKTLNSLKITSDATSFWKTYKKTISSHELPFPTEIKIDKKTTTKDKKKILSTGINILQQITEHKDEEAIEYIESQQLDLQDRKNKLKFLEKKTKAFKNKKPQHHRQIITIKELKEAIKSLIKKKNTRRRLY